MPTIRATGLLLLLSLSLVTPAASQPASPIEGTLTPGGRSVIVAGGEWLRLTSIDFSNRVRRSKGYTLSSRGAGGGTETFRADGSWDSNRSARSESYSEGSWSYRNNAVCVKTQDVDRAGKPHSYCRQLFSGSGADQLLAYYVKDAPRSGPNKRVHISLFELVPIP